MREREAMMVMDTRTFLLRCATGVGMCVCAPRVHAVARGVRRITDVAQEQPTKWSVEARYYEKTRDGVRCLKCPHGCELTDGDTGFCRSRECIGTTLWSVAYGNPCAVHVDPIEKKPLFHFLPTSRAFSIAAAGCNLRCLNCQNWQISQTGPRSTQNEELYPQQVVQRCLSSGCASIAYTYSEPTTFYEYASDTAWHAHRHGLRNVLKSNGYIRPEPLRALAKHLDAANIDLKSFDAATFLRLSGGALDTVLNTLVILKQEGVWLEITNLVIPSWTDDVTTIRRMSAWLVRNGLEDCPLHFTRFMPLHKLTHVPMTPVAVLDAARAAAKAEGMRYVYVGNVPGHSGENTYCHACGRLLLERRGFAILKNDMRGGTCGFCRTRIPGVWS